MDQWHSQLGVPYRVYRKRRAMVLSASRVCHICGGPGATTVDHVVPLDRGGRSTLANLKPAHSYCNAGKREREMASGPRISPKKGWGSGPTGSPPHRHTYAPYPLAVT